MYYFHLFFSPTHVGGKHVHFQRFWGGSFRVVTFGAERNRNYPLVIWYKLRTGKWIANGRVEIVDIPWFTHINIAWCFSMLLQFVFWGECLPGRVDVTPFRWSSHHVTSPRGPGFVQIRHTNLGMPLMFRPLKTCGGTGDWRKGKWWQHDI